MDKSEYKIVISSKHKLLNLNIKELFNYRDLIFLFVERDFKTLYKQTILGPLWAIIQPLFTTVVFTIVFGSLANLTTADVEGDFIIPSFLFYMVGNICWGYFSTTLLATSKIFITNKEVMSKIYYPRLVAPISTALSNMISFAIQFVMMMMIWAYFLIGGETSIRITPMLLLIPLCVVQMVILSVGCGIIVSAVTTKYRDLMLAVTFLVTLWQYSCPIAYGLKLVPENWLWLYMLNPITPVITTFRYGVFGFGYFNLTSYLVSWAVSILLFLIGVVMFSRIERTFVDTI